MAVYEEAGLAHADAERAAATVSLTRRLSRNGANPEQLLADTIAKATEIAIQFPRLRTRVQTAAAD